MTPGQEIARQGVTGMDAFHWWKGDQKRLAAGHEALDQLAASREEPLASSARTLQAMIAANPVQDRSLCRAGLEKMATASLSQSATSYVAAVALAAAGGLSPAEDAALPSLPTGTPLEQGVLGTDLSAHQKLEMLSEPGRIWSGLPDADLVRLGQAELSRDPRPGAAWLSEIQDAAGLRAGLQADWSQPLEVARAVHAASPLGLSQMRGLGWDGWLEESLSPPQEKRWIDSLLSAQNGLEMAEKLSGDDELADRAHRQACQGVLSVRPEMAEGLEKLRALSRQCRLPETEARRAERVFLGGSAGSSLADLAALIEPAPGLRQALGPEYPFVAALPATAEGDMALSAALAGVRAGQGPVRQALGRLGKAQDKLNLLATSQNELVVRLTRAETTPWTRVRAASAALEEPGSILKAGARALATCQEPAQEEAIGRVVAGLLREQWGDSPAVAQYLDRLKPDRLAEGLRELASLEEQGVLQLVAGRPTGSIEETKDGVVVGGVVLPKRD